MAVTVCDSSCLIDLREVSLLETFMALPFETLIPDALFKEELVRFTASQKELLLRGGLRAVELSPESVLRARVIVSDHPQLSIHDGFAFALAESCTDCVLFTGDRTLRAVGEENHLEVHGTLWVIDEIRESGLMSAGDLLAVLEVLADDPTVRLPRRELSAWITRYSMTD